MSKLKVLFFAADPLSVDGEHRRLLLDRESRDIKEEMTAALHRDRFEFIICEATRLTDLRRELLAVRPQIVHFSGHGGSEGLVIEDDDGEGPYRVDAAKLNRFFSAFRDQIQVVVLNACDSLPEANAITQVIDCAVGNPGRISDKDARRFSAAFYSSIAFGQSVQAAVNQARATLTMKGCPDSKLPRLAVRKGVDASTVVPIPPDPPPAEQTTTEPISIVPPVRKRRRLIWAATGVVLSSAGLYAVWPTLRPDPCEPAHQVLQEIREAGLTGQPPVRLLDAPAVYDPNDPLAGPRVLVEANRLHRTGNHDADFELFRQLAEAGNAEAMTSLGLAYLRGEGTPVLPDSGVKWLREAAGKDDPRGMNELGEAYVRGDAGARDLDYLAKHWFDKSAAAGYPEAMRNLGLMYREGLGVEADSALALDWFKRAVRAGYVDAMVDIGWMFEHSPAISPNQRQAMCWYRAAAKAGSARGRAALGHVDENARPPDDPGD
jgi:hypothetical protein